MADPFLTLISAALMKVQPDAALSEGVGTKRITAHLGDLDQKEQAPGQETSFLFFFFTTRGWRCLDQPRFRGFVRGRLRDLRSLDAVHRMRRMERLVEFFEAFTRSQKKCHAGKGPRPFIRPSRPLGKKKGSEIRHFCSARFNPGPPVNATIIMVEITNLAHKHIHKTSKLIAN
jgi:hypothetical protein